MKQEARETVRTFLERTHSWRDWVLACEEFLLFGFEEVNANMDMKRILG